MNINRLASVLATILLLSHVPAIASSPYVTKCSEPSSISTFGTRVSGGTSFSVSNSKKPLTSHAEDSDSSTLPSVTGEVDTTSAAEAPGVPITPNEYYKKLGVVQSDIDAAIESHAPSSLIAKAQSDILPLVRPTVIFQGSSVTVDNRPLLSVITRLLTMKPASKRHQTLLDVLGQLTAIRDGVVAPSSGVIAQYSETAAKKVLNKYEFGSDPVQPPSAFQEKLAEETDDFVRWLGKLFPKSHMRPMPGMHVYPWVGLALLYTILGCVLAFLAYLIIRSIIDAQGLPWIKRSVLDGQSALALTAREQELVASRDYVSLMELARNNAESGEHRDAYRIVYLAILVLLDSTGDLRIHRARTNWEYLYHIERTGKTEIFAILLPVTDSFDRIWYGYANTSLVDYQEIKTQFQSLRSLVLARAAAPSSGKAAV